MASTQSLIDKVEQELSKNLNINFSLSKDLSYRFFPRPSFTFKKVSFLNQVENLGKIKVDISPTQLFFSEDILASILGNSALINLASSLSSSALSTSV